MQIHTALSVAEQPTSVALGCFDGLHLGHCAVLGQALQAPANAAPAVFTFGTEEDGMIPVKKAPVLMSSALRERLLEQMGFSYLWKVNFQYLRNLSPEEFVVKILKNMLHAKKLCCGYHYRFGHGGTGNAQLLQQLGQANGMEVAVISPVKRNGETVSSSNIRAAIEAGNVKKAETLLGRPFQIDFPVVHGKQLGRLLGAPTMNQPFPKNFVLPKFGVYASCAKVDGQGYYAVTNVGVKPTVGSDGPLSETYIAGFSGDLYGKRIEVELLEFLRPEQKFDSLEQLKIQIFADAARSKTILEAQTKKNAEKSAEHP